MPSSGWKTGTKSIRPPSIQSPVSFSRPVSYIQEHVAEKARKRKVFDLSNTAASVFPSDAFIEMDVTVLSANNNMLSHIPRTIQSLIYLEEISLAHNHFTVFPSSLSSLPLLNFIELSYNQIEIVPNDLANLTSLQVLQLSHNKLKHLPESLEHLESLCLLILNANSLTTLPESIGRLRNLTRLDLRCNSLTTLPPQIGDLPNLRDLIVRCNLLRNIPDNIGNLSQLRTLNLRYNELDSLPSSIGDLHSMIELDVYGNNLSFLPSEIGSLPELDVFHIKQNPLDSSLIRVMRRGTAAVLSYLRAQSTLITQNYGDYEPLLSCLVSARELDLSTMQMSFAPSDHVGMIFSEHLLRIATLNLSMNGLGTISSSFLAKFANLKTLILRNNQIASLPSAIDSFQNLTKLDLSENKLTVLPQSLCSLTTLLELNLATNRLQALPTFIGQLQSLRVLRLDSNDLALLLKGIGCLSCLESLFLSRNQLAAIPPDLGQLSNLTYLDVSYNKLMHLPMELFASPALKHLNLRSNLIDGIPNRIANAQHLQFLDISYNLIEGKLPPPIVLLSSLRTLILDGQMISQFPPLSSLTSLTYLSVHSNFLRQLPSDFSSLVGLQHLDFSVNFLTNIPSGLHLFTKLHTLLLHGNHFPPHILSVLANLFDSPRENVTDEFVNALAKYLSSRTNITTRTRFIAVGESNKSVSGEELTKFIPDQPMAVWTPDTVQLWLSSLGLDRYCPIFKLHEVDGETLLLLTQEEIQNDLHINDFRSLHLLTKSIKSHKKVKK